MRFILGMINKTVMYEDGRSETEEVDLLEFPQHFSLDDVLENMIKNKASSILLNYDGELDVIFTRRKK